MALLLVLAFHFSNSIALYVVDVVTPSQPPRYYITAYCVKLLRVNFPLRCTVVINQTCHVDITLYKKCQVSYKLSFVLSTKGVI